MARRRIFVVLAVLALAATVTFSGAGASAPLRSDPPEPASPASGNMDYGDAPEAALVYPASGIIGAFPTCENRPLAPWIQHNNFGAFFGPSYDREMDGNAGLCQTASCFPPYDADECYQDNDAGLIMPQPFTINAAMTVVPCPNSQGTPLGNACQAAVWGSNIDISVRNNMPNQAIGYVNLLVDWNQDGQWGGSVTCPGGTTPVSEHALVDFAVPNGFNGPLSALGPPSFVIGPKAGHVWARFSITQRPVGMGWIGNGQFEDGESEDYLLLVQAAQPNQYDWGDAPDPIYPTLSASNGAFHILTPNGPVLGALVDAEPDGQPNAAATGDDVSNLADEDGVVFATLLLPGQQACVNAALSPARPPGVLSAWIDFDHSGVWGDGPGEQILAGVAVNPGPNVGLCFPVPATAQPGTTFARFRLISPIAVPLPPTGPAPDGEVEDYRVTIEAVKWDQPPVLKPESPHPNCYWGWDEPSVYGGERIVADDWKCSDRRPVTDVHWWGSYGEWDEKDPPQIAPASFHIGIWTDVPGPGFSHPGMMIWQTVVPRQATQERAAGCDFHPPMQAPDTCFLYSYKLPRAQWFYQDPDQNQVYWISISAMYPQGPPTAYLWGWKTRPQSVIDAAVRVKIPTAPQLESRFEIGEPILDFGEPWDMAFVLTTPAYDYGDAPDANYRTLLASDGARHIHWPNGPFIGAGVDTEGDGQPGPPALGDDNNATDDEDGVTIHGPWVIGQAAMLSVDMQLSPVACNLNAWVDFNANGSWEPGERVATDVALAAGLVHSLSFPIPPYPTAAPGITYARFRCSSQTGLGPAGEAPDGEVEDYRVELLAPPKPPVVTTSIVDADTLRLSWPKVATDIHGNPRLADGYRIYWNSSPYWTPLPGSQWMSQWEGSPPSLPNPVTQDADHLGAPSMHHFYIVRAVYTDIWGKTLESADSNRKGEFEFTLVPGSP